MTTELYLVLNIRDDFEYTSAPVGLSDSVNGAYALADRYKETALYMSDATVFTDTDHPDFVRESTRECGCLFIERVYLNKLIDYDVAPELSKVNSKPA
jgi:hypothetical protein